MYGSVARRSPDVAWTTRRARPPNGLAEVGLVRRRPRGNSNQKATHRGRKPWQEFDLRQMWTWILPRGGNASHSGFSSGRTRTEWFLGSWEKREAYGPDGVGCLPMRTRQLQLQIPRQCVQKRRKMAMKMIAIKPATAATMPNWNSQRESSGIARRVVELVDSRLGAERMMAGRGGIGD
jgi:hypothetical protein